MTTSQFTHFGDEHDPGYNKSPDAVPIPPRPSSDEPPPAAPADVDDVVERIRAAVVAAGVIAPESITPHFPKTGSAYDRPSAIYDLHFPREMTKDELEAIDHAPGLSWIKMRSRRDEVFGVNKAQVVTVVASEQVDLLKQLKASQNAAAEHEDEPLPLAAGDPPIDYADFAAQLAAEEPPIDEQDTRELPQEDVEQMLRRQKAQLESKLDDALTANNMLRHVVEQLTKRAAQRVEVKTLVQTINSHQPLAADVELANHLSEGWEKFDCAVTRSPNDINSHTRMIILVRKVSVVAPQPGARVAVEEQEAPTPEPDFPPVIIPPGAQNIYLNQDRFPIGRRIRQHGLGSVRAEMNAQAFDAGRASFYAALNTPRYSALPGRL